MKADTLYTVAAEVTRRTFVLPPPETGCPTRVLGKLQTCALKEILSGSHPWQRNPR